MIRPALRALAVVLIALAAGCVPPRAGQAPAQRGELSAHKRIAVIPFSDDRGLSERYAAELARGLWSLGYDVLSGDQLRAAMRELKMRPGEPLGPHSLLDLRRMTRVDAVMVGAVICPRTPLKRRASATILDTSDARALFELSFEPGSCGGEADVAAIVRRILAGVRSAMRGTSYDPMDVSF